jgi:hypothetical protein
MQPATAMQESDPSGVRPTTPQFRTDLDEPGNDLLVVGLIGEMLDATSSLGVITNGAAEQHHRAAVRSHGPLVRSTDRQFRLGEGEPFVDIGWALHSTHRSHQRCSRGHGVSAELYDLAFVEPGPLPPHERTWRHPSELGPTRADSDNESSNHLAALALGALAVIAVAGLVIAMTPRTSSSPIALSATTTPVSVLRSNEPPTVTIAATPPTRVATAAAAGLPASRIPIGALLTSFSAFPHAITSGPQLTLDGTAIATKLPDDHDIVLVRTEAVTYKLLWGEVPFLRVPDGSVIFDIAGSLLAHVAGGDVVTLVGD